MSAGTCLPVHVPMYMYPGAQLAGLRFLDGEQAPRTPHALYIPEESRVLAIRLLLVPLAFNVALCGPLCGSTRRIAVPHKGDHSRG